MSVSNLLFHCKKIMPPPGMDSLLPETAGFSALHPDIIESHILTRLDGPGLASAACCSTTLRRHSSPDYLWSNICHSTWPSTASPRVKEVISRFPGVGARVFFSEAFPLLPEVCLRGGSSTAPQPELISAVDIHHQGKLIFTKLQVTKTDSNWFRSSPFRIDLLDHKDPVLVPIDNSDDDDDKQIRAVEGVTLSWILIDPIARRAVNLSSHNPVATQRHWLTGEIQVRFASILTAADQGDVQCGIVVTCDGSLGKGMQVKEVRLEIENIDGRHLNGKESLFILKGALEAEKRTGGRRSTAEVRRRYREFEGMKRERREKEKRKEVALDTLCVAFGVVIFAAFFILICM